MRPARAGRAGSGKESEDGGWRMEKRGNRAARRDWTQTDCRAAIRQVGWLQHGLVTPQRSDGAITPCRVHAAFAISAAVIDRRYRRSIRHQHEPSR